MHLKKIFCGDIKISRVPTDLEDVSKYPNLFAELLRQGWIEKDLEKLAGKNMLRVMRRVEQVIYAITMVSLINL